MKSEPEVKYVGVSEAMLRIMMVSIAGEEFHVQSDEQLNVGDIIEFGNGSESFLTRLLSAVDAPPHQRLLAGHQIVRVTPVRKTVNAVEVCWNCHRRVSKPETLMTFAHSAPHGQRFMIECPHCASKVIGSGTEETVLRWNSSAALKASTMIFYSADRGTIHNK